MLNSTLSDNGTFILKYISKLTLKDFNNFSSLFFLNITSNNILNIIKVAKLKLLFKSFFIVRKILIPYKIVKLKNKQFLTNKLVLNQRAENIINLTFAKKQYKNCVYISNDLFYENEATYINTEGYIKRTTKLVSRKRIKSN